MTSMYSNRSTSEIFHWRSMLFISHLGKVDNKEVRFQISNEKISESSPSENCYILWRQIFQYLNRLFNLNSNKTFESLCNLILKNFTPTKDSYLTKKKIFLSTQELLSKIRKVLVFHECNPCCRFWNVFNLKLKISKEIIM